MLHNSQTKGKPKFIRNRVYRIKDTNKRRIYKMHYETNIFIETYEFFNWRK